MPRPASRASPHRGQVAFWSNQSHPLFMSTTDSEALPKQGEPISPAPREQPDLMELARVLEGHASFTLHSGRTEVRLPSSALRALRTAVQALAHGAAASVVRVDQELTTQQAAEILNVSRQYVVRLVDGNELAASVTEGGHRRLRLRDVLLYRKRRDERRRQALDEVEAETEAYGGYAKLKRG